MIKRKRSISRTNQDKPILDHILEIKAEHPLWGYRRIWAYLRYRERIIIGKNRIYRLLKEKSLLIKPNDRLKAKRYSTRPKPRANKPNQFWGIDMTKIKINNFGWLYLHVVLDWYTKEIVGYSLSLQSKTKDWQLALEKAVNKRFPEGIKEAEHDIALISDNGCQPTSENFMKACNILNIKQIFTTWNNPKGNADTERVMRTIKEDLIWPRDFDNPFELEKALNVWIKDYNEDFPHQSLKYKTPVEFYQDYLKLNFETHLNQKNTDSIFNLILNKKEVLTY